MIAGIAKKQAVKTLWSPTQKNRVSKHYGLQQSIESKNILSSITNEYMDTYTIYGYVNLCFPIILFSETFQVKYCRKWENSKIFVKVFFRKFFQKVYLISNLILNLITY